MSLQVGEEEMQLQAVILLTFASTFCFEGNITALVSRICNEVTEG